MSVKPFILGRLDCSMAYVLDIFKLLVYIHVSINDAKKITKKTNFIPVGYQAG